MFWKKKLDHKSKCSVCGVIHEDWPALTFNSPVAYFGLTVKEQNEISTLNSDFCTIEYNDQTNRFIRVVLEQKILKSNKVLNYGLWVSLSKESYEDYILNFDNNEHETQYFGWLNSKIPEYQDTLDIPTTVFTKKGTQRPEIVPYDDFEHEFVNDYYNGISKGEADKRIHKMLSNIG